jgi:hypothetical protein
MKSNSLSVSSLTRNIFTLVTKHFSTKANPTQVNTQTKKQPQHIQRCVNTPLPYIPAATKEVRLMCVGVKCKIKDKSMSAGLTSSAGSTFNMSARYASHTGFRRKAQSQLTVALFSELFCGTDITKAREQIQ